MFEGGLWEGELNGKKGMFPKIFVKVIEKKKEEPKEEFLAMQRRALSEWEETVKWLDGKRAASQKKKVVFSVKLYYNATQKDELTIKVGDIIRNVQKLKEGWLEGDLNGKRGKFPYNRVKAIEEKEEEMDSPSSATLLKEKDLHRRFDIKMYKNNIVVTLYGEDKTKIEVGDILEVTKQKKDLWESVVYGNKDGFPSISVDMIEKEEHYDVMNYHPPDHHHHFGKKSNISFSYRSENEIQTTIEVGDIIKFIKQDEEGKWKAILYGETCGSPSIFVELIEELKKTSEPDLLLFEQVMLHTGKMLLDAFSPKQKDKNVEGMYRYHGQKGLAIIIHFTENREGTEADVKKINNFLKYELTFETKIYTDLTKGQLTKILEVWAAFLNEKETAGKYYCLFVFLMAHGNEVL
ncbi:SH3 domain-containing kinase-binding protein 1-like [Crassostrea virginica]